MVFLGVALPAEHGHLKVSPLGLAGGGGAARGHRAGAHAGRASALLDVDELRDYTCVPDSIRSPSDPDDFRGCPLEPDNRYQRAPTHAHTHS